MLLILGEIILYWVSMGIIIGLFLWIGLNFAILCEKIVDLLFSDKYQRERFDQP